MDSIAFLPHVVIPALWALWLLYWMAAAGGNKRTAWREPGGRQWRHGMPLVLCLVLLAAPRLSPAALHARFVAPGVIFPVIGALAVALGLGFAVWARVILGRNWSGRVEVKEDHALIRGGPYRAVRHPIYTGMLLAVAGTALAIGEWRGVLATLCVLVGILIRMGAEERQMRRLFPEYEEYRRETAALIPFVL